MGEFVDALFGNYGDGSKKKDPDPGGGGFGGRGKPGPKPKPTERKWEARMRHEGFLSPWHTVRVGTFRECCAKLLREVEFLASRREVTERRLPGNATYKIGNRWGAAPRAFTAHGYGYKFEVREARAW